MLEVRFVFSIIDIRHPSYYTTLYLPIMLPYLFMFSARSDDDGMQSVHRMCILWQFTLVNIGF